MNGLIIQETREEDKEVLRHFWASEPEVLNWFPMVNEREIDDSVRIWMGFALKGGGLTAVFEGKVCGMAVLNFNPYLRLKHNCLISIIVGNGFRGKGIGSVLLKALESLALEKEIDLLHLEVYDENPAKRLYERFGYVSFGGQSHFSKEAIGHYRGKTMMEKRLKRI